MSAETLTFQAQAGAGLPVETPQRLRMSAAQRVRQIRAKFDAAQTTDENYRHWVNADSLGPNAALNPLVRRVVRNRARYEFHNNSYAHGIVRTRAMDVVGTGPTLQCQTGAGPDADEAVETAFWEWMLATKTPDKLLTLAITKPVAGEWFASFFDNPRLMNPVSLDYQPHEPEMIANPRLGFEGDKRDGIIVDDFGNVAGYMLLREHPGEQVGIGITNTADVVPAADMLHVFNCERPGQLRGISEVVSSLPLFAQLRRYTLAVIRSAEVSADVAGVLRSMVNPSDPNVADDPEPFDAFELDRGMFLTMPKGWDLTQLKSEQPTTTYAMFKREIICEIARCLSMPYNIAAGDSSGYNYSSARLDHRIYSRSIRVERFLIETSVLDRLFARWWEFARLAGVLPAEVSELRQPPTHSWRWDGEEYIDPQKEASAADIRLKTGTTHRWREYAAAGLDLNEEDAKAAASYGVTVEEYRKALFGAHFSGGAKQEPAPEDPGVDGEDADG